jgi:hypothetical protein
LLGELHVTAAHLCKPLGVEDDDALQTLNGAEDGEDFVEAARYLVEEAQLHLVQILLHLVSPLLSIVSASRKYVCADGIGGREVVMRYVLVASFH